jgi:hypothetical protein
VLIEPVLNGRSYVGAMSQRKKLRAIMTQNDLAQNATAQDAATVAAPTATQRVLANTDDSNVDDLDGWPLSVALRDELQSLDLMSQEAVPQEARPRVKTLVVQVGPREQLAPPLHRFSQNIGAATQTVVMKPFWNLVDYTRADALFESIADFEF